MRVLMKVSVPTESGNTTIKNELLPKTFGEFIEKPIDVDKIVLRHCRSFGALLLASAAILAFC